MKTLNETLSYKNDELFLRIQRAGISNANEARKILDDTKAWLWLCARHRNLVTKNSAFRKRLPFLRMLIHFEAIDIGWHQFLLMTREYSNFCNEFLDGYVHHTPAPVDKSTLQKKKDGSDPKYLENFFEFIIDELGEDRFQRWLNELPTVES